MNISRYNYRYNFRTSFIPRAATLTCFSTPPQKPPYILFIIAAAITIKLINDNDGPSNPTSPNILNNFISESFYLKDFKTIMFEM